MLVGAAVLAALTSCSHAPRDPSEVRLEVTDIGLIAEHLACDPDRTLYDDLDFYDSMRGIDCDNREDPVFVRIYATPSSTAHGLALWAGTLDNARQAIIGENWYAVGSPEALEGIARALDVAPEITTEIPPPTPLTDKQQFQSFCATVVTSLVQTRLFPGLGSSQPLAEYEQHFHGIEQVVETLSSSLADDGLTIETFRYELSKSGSEIKAFCSEAYE